MTLIRCSNCQKELREELISAGGSLRCDQCGMLTDTNFLGRAKRGVDIHPALVKRYATIIPKSDKRIEIEHHVDTTDSSHGDEIPKVIGYDILERIGKGAMGSVYRAIHLASGREAAVKVLSPELSSRADLVARFEREAAALRTFRHPNIVAILDSGNDGHLHYYCMEYLHGMTLRRHLKNGALSLETSIRYMRAVLKGLKAAHERGIIHRDLKPENVVVESVPEERLVLVDFGLAGIVNEAMNPHPNLTRSRVTMGTVNYMAPEQHIDAKRVDFRTDLYACGVILYECITGDLPLGRFALPTERGLPVPASVDACLSKALSRSLEDRYQSATEFDQALIELETELKENTNVYYMPIVKSPLATSASAEQKTATMLSTIWPTQWMTAPPWVKKPTWAYGFLALAAGLILGVMISRRTPTEVVVSEDRAAPVYAGSSFKAPVPVFHNNIAALQKSSSDVKLYRKWKSNSSVWDYRQHQIGYFAKQGQAGHFRRDISLITSPIDMPLSDSTFEAKITLERVKLPINHARAQQLARDLLGGTPELASGGIFYVDHSSHHAVGMMVFIDGSCGVAELRRQDDFLRFVQYARGTCKAPSVGKSMNIGIQCDSRTGQCQGFMDGKTISSLRIDEMRESDWRLAIGCRNMNCLFQTGS